MIRALSLGALVCVSMGCATVRTPDAARETVSGPIERPTARSAVVVQATPTDVITRLEAWTGATHFLTRDIEGVVAIHDVATGRVRAFAHPDRGQTFAVAASDHGTSIAFSNERGRYIWDLADGSFRSGEIEARRGSSRPVIHVPGTERVLLDTDAAVLLRATMNGPDIATVRHNLYDEIAIATDGRCLRVHHGESVHLYETERLRPVMTLPSREGATFAVMDGCEGLMSVASDGVVREHRVDGPEAGEPFASLPETMRDARFSYRLAIVDDDGVLVTNGGRLVRLVRGEPTPAFSLDVRRARVAEITRFGFLARGGVFAMGRDFIDRFDPSGYAASTCEGVEVITPPGTTRTIAVARAGYCDIETGDVFATRRHVGAPPERFVLRVRGTADARVFDLGRFGDHVLPDPLRMGTAVAISNDGETLAGVVSGAWADRGVSFQPELYAGDLMVGAGARVGVVSVSSGQVTGELTIPTNVYGLQVFGETVATTTETRLTVYRHDGTVLFERAIEPSHFTHLWDDRYAVISAAGASDVVDLASGVVLATKPGTAVEHRVASTSTRVTLLERDGTHTFVRVRDGAVETFALGAAEVVGASADGMRVAVCDQGRLFVYGIAGDDDAYAFGTCIDTDRVTVHVRERAVLVLRGLELALRWGEHTLSFVVMARGATPAWFVSADDGRFICPESALGEALFRAAGPLTNAALTPLDPARRALDVLAPLAALAF